MPEAELRLAMAYDCPECGAEQFKSVTQHSDGTMDFPTSARCADCKTEAELDLEQIVNQLCRLAMSRME